MIYTFLYYYCYRFCNNKYELFSEHRLHFTVIVIKYINKEIL